MAESARQPQEPQTPEEMCRDLLERVNSMETRNLDAPRTDTPGRVGQAVHSRPRSIRNQCEVRKGPRARFSSSGAPLLAIRDRDRCGRQQPGDCQEQCRLPLPCPSLMCIDPEQLKPGVRSRHEPAVARGYRYSSREWTMQQVYGMEVVETPDERLC